MKDKVYCENCKYLYRIDRTCVSNAKGDAISPRNGREQARVKNANNDCKEFEERPPYKPVTCIGMFYEYWNKRRKK